MSICSITSRNWANQSGLEKSGPFVYQAALSSYIILKKEKEKIRYRFTNMILSPTKTGGYYQFSSFAQSCPTLCDPVNRSTPGLAVHHQLTEFTQTHAHRAGDAIETSHLQLSPSPPAPNPSQHQGLFQWVNSSHEVAKVLEFQLQHQSFQWTPSTGGYYKQCLIDVIAHSVCKQFKSFPPWIF